MKAERFETLCPACGEANPHADEDGAVEGPREYHAGCWHAMSDVVRQFSYAVQVQPQNGQQLQEWPNGCELEGVTAWSEEDAARYPEAGRQLWEGGVLVKDTHNHVYAVPLAD